MNKLELVAGIEDAFEHWNWYQEGVQDSFKNLVSAFGIKADESFRISGCEVTVSENTPATGQTTYDITSGAICLEGEVLPVEAQSVIAGSGQAAFWTVDTSYSDVTPAEIFGGGQKNVQAVRKGVLVASNTQPSLFMRPKAQYLSTKIRNLVYIPGLIQMFDPTPLGKSIDDFFSLISGDGEADTEFEGWILLGFKTGYTDWGGKTPVGLDKIDPDFQSIGNTGGEKEHLLTGAESGLKDHDHDYVKTVDGNENQKFGTDSPRHGASTTQTSDSGNLDADEAHNNMQPYKVVAYIMRIA